MVPVAIANLGRSHTKLANLYAAVVGPSLGL
jgi:hypothetical protein